MRGPDVTQEGLFVTRQTADFVPVAHPLRAIREILNRALRDMDVLFESIYEDRGRYSVPPERLLRGLVLQALYGIRSERLLCEQLGYNLLYRWFVGLSLDEPAWDHSTYTKNRDRLIEHEVVRGLFGQVMQQAKQAHLLSDEHFSVDGTLIRAWASHKSFVPKDGPPPPSAGSRSNPEVDFKGKKRSNDTHASTTDPEARLFAKSHKQEAVPAYLGHVLMENRSKLAVDTRHFGDITLGLEDRLIDQELTGFCDIDTVVAHSFDIGDDLQRSGNAAQIARHRLLQGEQFQAVAFNFQIISIDLIIQINRLVSQRRILLGQ
jgi:transposase